MKTCRQMQPAAQQRWEGGDFSRGEVQVWGSDASDEGGEADVL